MGKLSGADDCRMFISGGFASEQEAVLDMAGI
jgi:hypothetical protein